MKAGGVILQVFQDTDLRCGHDGLAKVASKEKLALHNLEDGEYVCFFNSHRTGLKIAAAGHVIAYKKSPEGRFYDMACIQDVVRAFHNTGRIDYDEALKTRLTKLLGRPQAEAEGKHG
jgi:hypothetical protein